MALSSNGEYGVDKGLIFSYPCIRRHGAVRTFGGETGAIEVVENLPMNDYAQEKFNATLKELRDERDMVKSLGLLD